MNGEDQTILARQHLASLQVPPAFHDEIIARASPEQPASKSGLTGWLGTAAVFAYLGVAWLVWQGLEGLTTRHAEQRAEALGAVVVDVNFGLGLLLALFTVPLAAMALWPTFQIMGRSLRRDQLHVPASNLLFRKAGWLTRSAVKHAANSTTRAEEFLNAVYRWQVGWVAWPLCALAVTGLFITALETRSYFVAGPFGIEHGRMMPPFSTRTYAWSEAASVTLGCNSTDDDERLIYSVEFPDGHTFHVGEAQRFSQRRIPTLEAIDAQLPVNLPRKRWDWLGRNPMAELCVSAWSETVPDGHTRLVQLLRTSN